MNKKTSDTKHNQLVYKKTGKAINQFSMIKNNDKILVGLSGGKDSLVLLDVLAKRRKKIPIDYHLHAMHIDVENMPYHSNLKYLHQFCNERKITFHAKKIIVDFERKTHSKPCFLCSWARRKELFEYANKNSFNKLALGHNLDDALETLIINILNHANISSLPAKLKMFNNSLELIRPLIFLFNSDTLHYSKNNGFILQEVNCKYEDKTQREQAARIIQSFTNFNKKAKENLFNSMSNIDPEYLPRIEELKKLI